MKRLILLIGPTGTGKSTIEAALNKAGVPSVVSYTTRPIRSGEVDGVNYHFITVDQVEALEERGEIIQKVFLAGNYYGSTFKAMNDAFANSNAAVIVVEPTGLTQFQEYARRTGAFEVVSVYIDNELDVLTSRLIRRYQEDAKGDASVYWVRLVHLYEQYHAWREYTNDWNLYFSGVDDTTPGLLTVQEATEKILGAFVR